MPRRRPNTTEPDPQLIADLGACLRDSPHLHTLIGLMHGRGVDLVPVRGRTDHGVDWAAMVLVGAANADALDTIAAAVGAALAKERERLRIIAERG